MAYEKKKNDESVKILKNHIKEKNLAKLYVFCGEESYLKEYYRKTIEKMISTGGFDSFNIIYLDDEAITEDSLTDAIESLPFGAEEKLIVLRDPQVEVQKAPAGGFRVAARLRLHDPLLSGHRV